MAVVFFFSGHKRWNEQQHFALRTFMTSRQLSLCINDNWQKICQENAKCTWKLCKLRGTETWWSFLEKINGTGAKCVKAGCLHILNEVHVSIFYKRTLFRWIAYAGSERGRTSSIGRNLRVIREFYIGCNVLSICLSVGRDYKFLCQISFSLQHVRKPETKWNLTNK